MRWLYRLQSRLGLAAPEGTAALALLVALTAGTLARHMQASAAPVAPDVYAASDAAFEGASADEGGLSSEEDSGAHGHEAASLAHGEAEARVPPPGADRPPASVALPVRVASTPGPARTRVNTASEVDLERLPGIGPALAARVVAYREQVGRFRSADQLAEVKGIGPKTVEKMRPWVVID